MSICQHDSALIREKEGLAVKILSFVNQKGGTGKSILALNLAVAAEQAGEKACLLDLDTQGTVANWYSTRTAETPPVLNHEQVGDLGQALDRLAAAAFSVAIIDTKGEDSHGTRIAMQHADLCLIPIRPAGPDLHASRSTMEALRAMGREFALVINQASPNKAARITSAVMTSLQHNGPIMPTAIASRMDHQYAYALGQAAMEYAPDGKAAEEIKELWAWCRKRLAKGIEHEQAERGAGGAGHAAA
jgi:chromosome partitioning protein